MSESLDITFRGIVMVAITSQGIKDSLDFTSFHSITGY